MASRPVLYLVMLLSVCVTMSQSRPLHLPMSSVFDADAAAAALALAGGFPSTRADPRFEANLMASLAAKTASMLESSHDAHRFKDDSPYRQLDETFNTASPLGPLANMLDRPAIATVAEADAKAALADAHIVVSDEMSNNERTEADIRAEMAAAAAAASEDAAAAFAAAIGASDDAVAAVVDAAYAADAAADAADAAADAADAAADAADAASDAADAAADAADTFAVWEVPKELPSSSPPPAVRTTPQAYLDLSSIDDVTLSALKAMLPESAETKEEDSTPADAESQELRQWIEDSGLLDKLVYEDQEPSEFTVADPSLLFWVEDENAGSAESAENVDDMDDDEMDMCE